MEQYSNCPVYIRCSVGNRQDGSYRRAVPTRVISLRRRNPIIQQNNNNNDSSMIHCTIEIQVIQDHGIRLRSR